MRALVHLSKLFDEKVRELRKCEFVGEIALTEDELRSLAQVVRRDLLSYVPDPGADERLILAAVNCAYFYMDEDGFWLPFCKVLEIECVQTNRTNVGRRIENALVNLDRIDKRGFGPNRFVTPIRMEAGLTKHDIPIFADLLNRGHQELGWPALHSMPDSELAAFIECARPGTRFTVFLKDPRSGGRLLRDVVRHLLLRRQELIDESSLNSLRGYRPGFWSELLSRLGSNARTAMTAASAEATPIFFFDVNRGECGLLFARELVNRGAYRFDGQPVRESFKPLRRIEEFYDKFTVIETKGGNTLFIPAWKPTESAPFGLFKQDGEYLPRDSTVHPGSYILVAFRKSTPPDSVSCISDFEFCATPELRFWHVEVDSQTDVAALGYSRSGPDTPVRLTWSEAGVSLDGVSEACDVFVGRLPRLRVSPALLFRENRAALCWRAGEKTGRLQVTGDGEDAVVDFPFNGPCRGEIWVEPLGREREDSGLENVRLRFCSLPKCRIEWPVDLYAQEDEPRVEFHAFAPGIECDFSECERVENAEASWIVPAGSNWVEGQVEADEVAVRVAKRIHRAGAENTNGENLWLERSALRCDDLVRIRGLPGASVHLELEGHSTRIDIPLHQKFNQHGVAIVRYWDFHDGISSAASPVYRIWIHGRSGAVPTLGRIVDFSEIEKWLFDDARQPEPGWLPLLGAEGFAALQSLVKSFIEPRRADFLNSLSKRLPEFFTRWARSIFACACIFSANRPPSGLWVSALDALPVDWRKTLEWVMSTEVALAEGGDLAKASNEFTELAWQPPYAAWRSFLGEIHGRMRAEYDLVPLVVEWRDEIERSLATGVPAEWTSALARMPGGKHLNSAYYQNLRSEPHLEDQLRYKEVLKRAYTALSSIEPSSPPLVHGLARLLRELLLIKFGGPVDPTGPLPSHCHRLIRPLLSSLIKARDGASQFEDGDAASALQTELLPLPESDRAQLRALL